MRNKVISLLTITIGVILQLLCACNLPMFAGFIATFAVFLTTATVAILFAKNKTTSSTVELQILATVANAVYVALSILFVVVYNICILTDYPVVMKATEPTTAIVKEHIWTSEAEYLIIEHSENIRTTLKVHGMSVYLAGDIVAIRYNPDDPYAVCADTVTVDAPLITLCTEAGNPSLMPPEQIYNKT